MYGRLAEPIDPIRPAELVEVHRSFAEPIGAAETIEKYITRLVRQLAWSFRSAASASVAPISLSIVSTTPYRLCEPGPPSRSVIRPG